MVLAHTATACRQYFHPWIIKKGTWKLSPTLQLQINEKSRKCLQSGSPGTPKMDPKIYKNGNLDL